MTLSSATCGEIDRLAVGMWVAVRADGTMAQIVRRFADRSVELAYEDGHTQHVVIAPQSAGQSTRWWAGVPRGVLVARCNVAGAKPKDVGDLVATDTGITFTGKPQGGIRWDELARFEIVETQKPHGRQHSAVGVGPLGVAFVAATAVHNARAAKIDVSYMIRMTSRSGEGAEFWVSPASSLEPALALVALMKRAG